MKGVKKCIKLLTLSTIFLPLFGISSSVSALSYTVDSFTIHGTFYPTITSGLFGEISAPRYYFTEDIDSLNDYSFRNSSYITASYNSSTEKCDYISYNNPGYTYSSSNSSYTLYYHGIFSAPYSLSTYQSILDSHSLDNNANYNPNFVRCMNKISFDTSSDVSTFSIPPFNNSAPINQQINVSSMLPYHYMFDNLYFNSTRTVDGVQYSSSFDISELLPQAPRNGSQTTEDLIYYTSKIKLAQFPLNFDSSLESLNSSVSISGSFILGDPISSSDLSKLRVRLDINNYYSDCSLSISSLSDNVINYICSYTPSTSLDMGYGLSIRIYTSDSSSILSTDTSWTFSNITVILNGNSSYYGSGSFDQSGSFPNTAPGSPDVHSDSGDYFSSIVNMFSFDFMNPFAPLFNMFTNGSNCASIPIIAGMLGSSETTYCPWWPASVRNVLTPVFGLASTMLVFGFLVRWLSSSSGNMFEDQTTHKWGNTQIKQGGK